MLDRLRRPLIALTLLFAAAGTALASVALLTDQAATLLVGYEDLESRVLDCPDGNCAEAQDLLGEREDLEADRLDLETERAAIGNCTDCQALDGLLDDLEVVAASVASGTGDWFDDE